MCIAVLVAIIYNFQIPLLSHGGIHEPQWSCIIPSVHPIGSYSTVSKIEDDDFHYEEIPRFGHDNQNLSLLGTFASSKLVFGGVVSLAMIELDLDTSFEMCYHYQDKTHNRWWSALALICISFEIWWYPKSFFSSLKRNLSMPCRINFPTQLIAFQCTIIITWTSSSVFMLHGIVAQIPVKKCW